MQIYSKLNKCRAVFRFLSSAYFPALLCVPSGPIEEHNLLSFNPNFIIFKFLLNFKLLVLKYSKKKKKVLKFLNQFLYAL